MQRNFVPSAEPAPFQEGSTGATRSTGIEVVLALPVQATTARSPVKKPRSRKAPSTSTAKVPPTRRARVNKGKPKTPQSGLGIQAQSFLASLNQMREQGYSEKEMTMHVITIMAGEDIFSRIMSFCQPRSSAVSIISASGAVSSVTFNQLATTGQTITYEGTFEILSLCGSFFLSEATGLRSRTGGLSISLAGSDGRVIGGRTAGILTAATPVQGKGNLS